MIPVWHFHVLNFVHATAPGETLAVGCRWNTVMGNRRRWPLHGLMYGRLS